MFKIFIGNIPLNASIQELISLFGRLLSVQVVGFIDASEIPQEHLEQLEQSRVQSQVEYAVARPTKFGFVEIASRKEARALIKEFNRMEMPDGSGHVLLMSGTHGDDEP